MGTGASALRLLVRRRGDDRGRDTQLPLHTAGAGATCRASSSGKAGGVASQPNLSGSEPPEP